MYAVGSYEGLKNDLGQRHGQGKYVFSNSFFTYEGDWVDGVKHGNGKFALGDGSVYEGSFINGEISGEGQRRWPNGVCYVGQFEMGEFQGVGRHVDAKGVIYEGNFRHNRRHGSGTLKFTDGSTYEGDFLEHKRTGQGTLLQPDGTTYTGQWEDNLQHGTGVMKWSSGAVYDGEWYRGLKEGTGTFDSGEEDAVRRSYVGEWESGKPLNPSLALAWQGVEGQEQEGAPSEAGTATEGPEVHYVNSVAGSLMPPIVLRCIDSDGNDAKESGRVLTVALKRFVFKEDPSAAQKGGKKPPKGAAAAPEEAAAPPEVLCEVVLGSITSVSGVVTFSDIMVPVRNAPDEMEDVEAQVAYEGELVFAEVTPDYPLLQLKPLDLGSFPIVRTRVEAPPAESRPAT